MGKIIASLLFALMAAGCASTPPTVVRVPVPVKAPEPPTVIRPHLPINDLQKDDPPAPVVRAYASSVRALQGYAEQLEGILDGYRSEGKK